MLVPYANTDQGGYITAVCGFDTRPYYKYFDVTYDLPNGYAPSYGRSRVEEMPRPCPRPLLLLVLALYRWLLVPSLRFLLVDGWGMME